MQPTFIEQYEPSTELDAGNTGWKQNRFLFGTAQGPVRGPFQEEYARKVITKSWEERLNLIGINNNLHLFLNYRWLKQLIRKLACRACRMFSFSPFLFILP